MPTHKVHVLYAELAHCESRLVDTGRLRTRSQHVGLYGDVSGVCYPVHLVKEARARQHVLLLREVGQGRGILWGRVH